MNEESSIPKNIDSYSSSARNVNSVISLLAILHVVNGLLFIPYIVIIYSETYFYTTGSILMTFLLYLLGGLLLTTLPMFFILGAAIWNGRPWVWKTSVIANSMCLILTILGQIIFPAILNIILLLILNNTDVRYALQP